MADQNTLILAATIITALSSVALAFLTASLISVSRKSNEINSSAELNVHIEHNQWSMVCFDVVIFNSGRAAAYDINLHFSPDFTETTRFTDYQKLPFDFSVLNPNSEIRMTFRHLREIKDDTINFTLTWGREHRSKFRKVVKTQFAMRQVSQQQYVEKLHPSVKIAEQITKIATSLEK